MDKERDDLPETPATAEFKTPDISPATGLPKKKPGRPTKYKPDWPQRAYQYGKQGLTNAEIAGRFGIADKYIYWYKQIYPDFSNALSRGKDEYDTREMESVLRKRALGYDYEEGTKFKNAAGEEVKDREIVNTRHMPGDVKAIQFWLTNRNKDRWQNQQVVVGNQQTINVFNPEMHTADLPSAGQVIDIKARPAGEWEAEQARRKAIAEGKKEEPKATGGEEEE
jgi:hypothetical protein